MTTRDPGCQCEISPEMVWAGPAIQLCHHSSMAEAERVREKLIDLMTNFAQNIDPNSMFDKTIIQLAEEYRKQAAGRLRRMLNEDEHHIININFMRNLSLAAQMITCTMIITRNEAKNRSEPP
jgi:hypothetical protein